MIDTPIKIFGLSGSADYAKDVVEHVSYLSRNIGSNRIQLTEHEEKTFEDGEFYLKPDGGDDGNVRGHNTFVIQSLYSDNEESAADKLMKLNIMCSALKSASAKTITAVVPYLAWSRQDRKTTSRAPVTTKLVANLLQAAGVTHILMIDVHNLAAIQNAFDITNDNLEGKGILTKWCASNLDDADKDNVVIMSPDAGGMSRAERFRNSLAKKIDKEVRLAVFDKLRRHDGSLSGGNVVGDINGASVILVDDLIATGSTIAKAAAAIPLFGGKLVAVCATHGIFAGNANDAISKINAPIVVCDTVKPFRVNAANLNQIKVVSTTRLVANAIWRIHSGTGSISQLLTDWID